TTTLYLVYLSHFNIPRSCIPLAGFRSALQGHADFSSAPSACPHIPREPKTFITVRPGRLGRALRTAMCYTRSFGARGWLLFLLNWLILLALSVLLSMRFSVWLGSAPSLASVCEESSCSLQRTRTVSAHHLTQDSTNATWGLAA
ncbi:hypothetical protein E4T50_15919, partial [Aureobasidium sp. EXF-12298]